MSEDESSGKSENVILFVGTAITTIETIGTVVICLTSRSPIPSIQLANGLSIFGILLVAGYLILIPSIAYCLCKSRGSKSVQNMAVLALEISIVVLCFLLFR